MDIAFPTTQEAVLVEIVVGAIFGIIPSLTKAVSITTSIGFIIGIWLFLGLNSTDLQNISIFEAITKIEIVIPMLASFAVHSALFDTGSILTNKVISAFRKKSTW